MKGQTQYQPVSYASAIGVSINSYKDNLFFDTYPALAILARTSGFRFISSQVIWHCNELENIGVYITKDGQLSLS